MKLCVSSERCIVRGVVLAIRPVCEAYLLALRKKARDEKAGCVVANFRMAEA